MSQRSENELATEYFLNGFIKGQFKDPHSLSQLNTLLKAFLEKELKPGFSWVSKYKKSRDLRPRAIKYDSVFLDVLFKNEIPKLIKQCTGTDLILGHFQVRIAEKGGSYTNWHRDAYSYGGQPWCGTTPPTHKMIYYFDAYEQNQPMLHVIPGSHRSMSSNKYIDILQPYLKRKYTAHASQNEFLLFNTSLFHNVAKQLEARGSMRIIYSFLLPHQASRFPDNEDLHLEYTKRLKLQ